MYLHPPHTFLSLKISSRHWIKNRIFDCHTQSRSRTQHCSATLVESCRSVPLITHMGDRPSPVCLLVWVCHTLHSTPYNRRHTGKTCWFHAPDVIQCRQGVLPGPLCHQKNHPFASLFLPRYEKVTVFQARCLHALLWRQTLAGLSPTDKFLATCFCTNRSDWNKPRGSKISILNLESRIAVLRNGGYLATRLHGFYPTGR
jgi:hypothetical protein